jgi:hypothetical protein
MLESLFLRDQLRPIFLELQSYRVVRAQQHLPECLRALYAVSKFYVGGRDAEVMLAILYGGDVEQRGRSLSTH